MYNSKGTSGPNEGSSEAPYIEPGIDASSGNIYRTNRDTVNSPSQVVVIDDGKKGFSAPFYRRVMEPTGADRFFNFISTRTVAQRRIFWKEFRQDQKGEERMVVRFFAKMYKDVGDVEEWEEKGSEAYLKWVRDMEVKLYIWIPEP